MFFTLEIDSLQKKINKKSSKKSKEQSDSTDIPIDSSDLKLRKLIKDQHLFLLESISERKFLYPDKNNEKILASRTSGFNTPSFTLLATQLQSFSFYEDFLLIENSKYHRYYL